MYCPQCGSPYPASATACARCGAFLGLASAPVASGAPLVPIDQSLGTLPLDFPLPVADSLGALMDQAFKLFLKNLKLLATIIVVGWTIPTAAMNYFLYSTGQDENFALAFRLEMWAEGLVGSLVAPATIYALISSMRGHRPAIGECYRWGRRQWARTFGNRLLAGIVMMVGLILLIVPGIIFWTWYAFVDPIVAIEGDTRDRVLTRSKELTEGIRWRIFGAAAIAITLVMLGGILSGIILVVVDNWWIASALDMVVEIAIQFLTAILLVAYLDRRRKEQLAGSGADAMFAVPLS